MGNVTSNIFTFSLDPNISIELKEYIDKEKNTTKTIKQDCENKRLNIKTTENTSSNENFNIIRVDKNNFSNYQYSILSQKNIAYIKEDNVYKFITSDYYVYIISDETLIKLILNMPRPRKIVYEISKNEHLTTSIYSMQLLANILENFKTHTIDELLNLYNIVSPDQYSKYHSLIDVFSKYEILIYKKQYNSYINFEQKVYNIFSSIEYNIDSDLLKQRKEVCKQNIDKLKNKLNISNIDINSNSETILSYISSSNSQNVFPSLNTQFIKAIKLEDYFNFVELLNEKRFIDFIDTSLMYDTYSQGCICSIKPYITNYTNKTVVIGTYKHLNQSIIAELLKNDKYIELVNNDKNIIEYLLIKNNIQYSTHLLIMLEWTLMALMNGCNTIDEYINYIFTNYSTLLSSSDIESLLNIVSSSLNELTDSINNIFKNKSITDNLILHEKVSPFYHTMLSIRRKLFKKLIINISEYIDDFNSKNKSKLYFIGYDNDSVYIECEEDSLNVAIDTLTRTLIRIYDNYLKRTKAHCYIEKL